MELKLGKDVNKMGCDIHCYREKLVNGQWVTADEWINRGEYFDVQEQFSDRDYRLFSLIADGVRGSFPFSVPARGLPLDLSAEVENASKEWDCDGHSHSFLTKRELKNLLNSLNQKNIKVSGMKDPEGLKKYQESIDSGNPDYDLIFPFCAWSSNRYLVSFETDIPASYMIGRSLKKLISTLDDVDGDDQRIVFWFDN